ncbi:MAG: pyridoxal phosphate-dependent aminotransferase [Vicinamibacterales bacterium]
MLTDPLAPYLLWAKRRAPAAIDLAGSNLVACTWTDVPGAREAVALTAPNDDGYGPLLERIAAHYGRSPDAVATAGGCSGANFLVVAALVGAGDHVLVEQPTYDPLLGICHLLGARVRRFQRTFDEGFRVVPGRVREALTPQTRLVVITAPHNPSGVDVDEETLVAVAREADRVGAVVLVDEVYLDLANAVAPRPRRAAASLDGPFVSTSSLTKSYGLAGLRAGWAVAPAAIAERLRRTRDVVDNAGSAPADSLAAHAWSRQPALLARGRAVLDENLAACRRLLAACPELEVAAPPAASVVFPRLAGQADAGPFVARTLADHGVAVGPGTFFDAPAHFRVSLASAPARVVEGLDRLAAAVAAGRRPPPG